MAKYPAPLIRLIEHFKRLPGVGNKSAERFAFHLIEWPELHLTSMGELINNLSAMLSHCSDCGCLTSQAESCAFCSHVRDENTLCIVASARDAFTIASTAEYHGHYHVLGGVLSPLTGMGPEELSLDHLKTRLTQLPITEVVIALDATLEGDTTALFLKQELAHFNIAFSRLAFGIPIGSALDIVDGGTLSRALAARGRF